MGDGPWLFPLAFLASLALALALYWVGGMVGARGRRSRGKEAPYACGERLPAREHRMNVERFFIYVVYFLIFDVYAFMIATSSTTVGVLPILYALFLLLATCFIFFLEKG